MEVLITEASATEIIIPRLKDIDPWDKDTLVSVQ